LHKPQTEVHTDYFALVGLGDQWFVDKAYNLAEREAAEEEGRPPVLLTMLTLHECRHAFASLLIDTGQTRKQFRSS